MKNETQMRTFSLLDYLYHASDEKHPVSVQDILKHWKSRGIDASRKSVYHDIDLLVKLGIDVVCVKSTQNLYFIGSRLFELPELKLLVDAVQSSRFLTTKKSLELIEKLGRLASIHEAGSLKRQVVVSGRVKTMVESIYYLVDQLQEAISQNCQISFRYFEWGVDGQRHFRPGRYEASPYALVWDNENYYLVAHSQRHGITHYRVDKMADIQSTGKPRFISPEVRKLSAAAYGRNVFGMFSGETAQVHMRFHKRLAGVVLDRFGPDTMLIPDGPDHFTFTMDIAVSPLFLGWLAGFGADATILSPDWVIEAYRRLLQPSLEQYQP